MTRTTTTILPAVCPPGCERRADHAGEPNEPGASWYYHAAEFGFPGFSVIVSYCQSIWDDGSVEEPADITIEGCLSNRSPEDMERAGTMLCGAATLARAWTLLNGVSTAHD